MNATGATVLPLPAATPAKRRRKVPAYLVKDEIDGVKFYYRGYKQVLNKTKQPEEIMGCSSLQALLVEYLLTLLYLHGANRQYRLFTGESGSHLALHNNLQFDIALYQKSQLPGDKITRRYVQAIAPELMVEIDLDIEWEGGITEDYLMLKTNKLLEFGTKKVVWILTRSHKVLIATTAQAWQIHDWDTELELLDGLRFNIAGHLAAEGVDPDAP